jgi:hypothetical protein
MPRWLRWCAAQNAHLLTCKLRFFAAHRLAIIGLIDFSRSTISLDDDQEKAALGCLFYW